MARSFRSTDTASVHYAPGMPIVPTRFNRYPIVLALISLAALPRAEQRAHGPSDPWNVGLTQATTPPAPLIKETATVKLSEHVWAIPDFNVGLVPNVGIIAGSRGTLVVDTGLGPRNGEAIVREMKKVSRTPEVYVVTTHYHPEHSLGDASLIARDREFLQAVQGRVGELKRAGKSIDEVVAAVVADIAPKYPEWGNPSGAAAVARAAYAEAN